MHAHVDHRDRKKHTTRRLVLGALALLSIFLAWFFWQLFRPNPPITVSRETTYITEPLGPDGLPDYGRYLLDRAREGVTPQNNGAVLFWRAMWPGELKGEPELQRLLWEEIGEGPMPDGSESLVLVWDAVMSKKMATWLAQTNESEDLPRLDSMEWMTLSRTDLQGIGEKAEELEWLIQSQPWDPARLLPLAEWLRENKPAIDLLIRAGERSEWYSPNEGALKGVDFWVGSYSALGRQNYRDPFEALSARSCSHLGRDDPVCAWRDCRAMYQISKHYNADRIGLAESTSLACYGIADRTCRLILNHQPLPIALAREIEADLVALGPESAGIGRYHDAERIAKLAVAVHLLDRRRVSEMAFTCTEEVSRRFEWLDQTAYDGDWILRSINRAYDDIAATSELSPWAVKLAKYPRSGDLWFAHDLSRWDLVKSFGDKTKRTEIFTEVFRLPAINHAGSMFILQSRDLTNAQLTRVAAALALHRAEHGAYPDRLDALVPNILPEAPVDLFHNKPLVYRRTDDGYLLYSLGANGVDDGGSCEADNGWGGLTFEGRSWRYLERRDPQGRLQRQIPAGADDISHRTPVWYPPWPELPGAPQQ